MGHKEPCLNWMLDICCWRLMLGVDIDTEHYYA